MAVKWTVRVEYVFDKFEAKVDSSWVKDFVDCPAYDPHRQYRVFWSLLDEDTPELMLDRVSEIPILDEKQEKELAAGYWRACILGVEDDPLKFKTSRCRKPRNRGKNGEQSTKGRSTKKSSTIAKDTASASKAVQARSTRYNLAGTGQRNGIFSSLDKQVCSGDFESDDSDNDPSLITDSLFKVMEASVRNLRKKLLEKCSEVETLERKLSDRDAELEKLRQLNRALQERVLDKVCDLFSSPRSTLHSSRSSSISSINSLFDVKSPLCENRTRTESTSSPVGKGTYNTSNSNKRKTPPTPATKANRESDNTAGRSEKRSPPPKRFHQRHSDVEDPHSSPMKFHNSLDSSSATLVNSPPDDSLPLNNDLNHDSPVTEPQASQEQPSIENLVKFLAGLLVDKRKLKAVEDRPLCKAEDGTYVKELAVLVFGMKVLYSSSLSERKYSSKKSSQAEEESENKQPRPKLNKSVISEIAKRVMLRVNKEFNGQQVPIEHQLRYKQSVVNRFIYDKIKKMKKNKALQFLRDPINSMQ